VQRPERLIRDVAGRQRVHAQLAFLLCGERLGFATWGLLGCAGAAAEGSCVVVVVGGGGGVERERFVLSPRGLDFRGELWGMELLQESQDGVVGGGDWFFGGGH